MTEVAECHFFFYCLFQRHASRRYALHEGEACGKKLFLVIYAAGNKSHGYSQLLATHQYALRQLAHQDLAVGTNLARYHHIGILYLIVEASKVQEKVCSRLHLRPEILHEGIAQTAGGSRSRFV